MDKTCSHYVLFLRAVSAIVAEVNTSVTSSVRSGRSGNTTYVSPIGASSALIV